MAESSLLETTAQIGIAFAGFIGIFLVLASRDGRFRPGDAMGIQAVVICSVWPAFYSGLPLVLYALEVPEIPLWRIAGAIAALAHVTVCAYQLRSAHNMPEGEKWPLASLQVAGTGTLGILMLVCFGGNALAQPWVAPGGAYLLGVWSALLCAAILFVGLIFRRVL
jgi:hypothetical protein